MSQNDEIKVSDAETLEWMSQLSDADKQTLKLRALERRATDLLQPKPEAPNFAGMSDQELERYKIANGFYDK
jgi:16S rRNA U1498 N3-methylase RsmE